MNKILLAFILFSTASFAAYKAYDPHKDSKYVNQAISGVCKSEHQRYDDLDFDLKLNVDRMSEIDADKAVANLKDAKRKRWECIEKELNKKSITLGLDTLFKEDNL